MEETQIRQMLPIGTLLKHGEYRVVRYIASGGFGNTYEVEHVRLGKHLALKEFFMRGINQREGTRVSVSMEDNRQTFNQMREKFYKEAQRLARLEEHHIVEVTDFFEENETAYYVMKLIDGSSLSAMMKQQKRPFTEDEVRRILPQILSALKTVHGQGIFHLDIKPGNIMQNAQGFCWVIDFGASKQLSAQESMTLSTSTGLCYTPGYAPSEQISGSIKRIGAWTDFYALGATLYNLLTNEAPPEVDDVTYEGESAFHFPSSVGSDMCQLVLWLMQADYRRRPQSVADIEQRIAVAAESSSVETVVNDKPHQQESEGTQLSNKFYQQEFAETESVKTELAEPEISEPVAGIEVAESSAEYDDDDSSNGLSAIRWIAGIIVGAAVVASVFMLIKYMANRESEINLDKPQRESEINHDKSQSESAKPISYSDEDIYSFIDDRGNYGFRDELGNVVIPGRWDRVVPFSDGMAGVRDFDKKWGFINMKGDVVIPCQWDSVGSFKETLANVRDSNKKWGFINKSGEVVFPCQWVYAFPFSEGLAAVEKDYRFGYINTSGELVIRYKWYFVGDFREGLAYVVDDFWDYGFIDKTGRVVIPYQWKDAGAFSEGLAAVQKEGKYGFIDKSGNVVIPYQWKNVSIFREDLAPVMNDEGKWGYINKMGELVISYQWDFACPFNNGIAFVRGDNSEWFKIDKTGKVI